MYDRYGFVRLDGLRGEPMNARNQAILYRFALGLVLVEIPVLTSFLTSVPRPEWPILLSGLLGGLAGAITKYLEPQLVSLTTVPGEPPAVVGVALKDVSPAPVRLDRMDQMRPSVDTLDTVGAQDAKP